MTCVSLTPAEAARMIDAGARLVDIRAADEHARERIPGATNLPLDRIEDLPCDQSPVIFHCKSGMRTDANAARLSAAAAAAPAYLIGGGIDGWRRDGRPVLADKSQPLEIMRQVQIVAGILILTGVILGFLWSPAFFGLAGFVGAGLLMAGSTGWCGMAHLLGAMPWNRRAAG